MINATVGAAIVGLSTLVSVGASDGPIGLACAPALTVSMDTALERVYRSAQTWESFLREVDRRVELWNETWSTAAVPGDLAARARAAGTWRVVIITVPGCSDSVNSVPVIAKLVEETPGLEMRFIDSTVGRPWMETHRSPDGRPSTPTVLVLDEQFNVRGCWVEQPAALQEFWLPILERGEAARELERKMDWYKADAGREVLKEIVEVLEGARDGQPICPGMDPT